MLARGLRVLRREKKSFGGRHPVEKVRAVFNVLDETHSILFFLRSVFRVPTTHDVLTLFHPGYPKSHLDILSLFLLGSQIVAFALLPTSQARPFFLAYFAFWRIAYDVGLGWVLTKQSKRKWIVREMQRLGWLDEKRHPAARAWIRKQLAGKMGKDYSFDVRAGLLRWSIRDADETQELPLEYNTWLLFRQVVDIILLKYVLYP